MYKSTILFLLGLFLVSSLPAQKKVKPDAIIKTEFGDIKIRLFKDTPVHRDNFLKLSKEKFYNGTTFHRVIKSFMIQGGDPNTKDPAKASMAGRGGPGYTLKPEINTKYVHHRGMLATARMPDQMNPKRESNGSQFYIVHGRPFSDRELDRAEKGIRRMTEHTDFKYTAEQRERYKTQGGYPWLDGQYTVFGEVIEGMDVIDKIAQVKTMQGDKPVKDVTMTIKAKAKPSKKKK